MSYKICSKCGKRKHKGKSFFKDLSKKDGVYPSCKDCYRERMGIQKRAPRTKQRRDGSTIRRCSTCKKYKAVSNFYRNPKSSDGIHDHCKHCSRKHAQSEASKAGQKTRRQRNRMTVLLHYSDGKPQCRCCGESENKFLCIDHINGGGRKHRAEVGSHFYRWIINNGFPSGLQILCHNCNMAKGFYNQCPHETNKQKIQKNN